MSSEPTLGVSRASVSVFSSVSQQRPKGGQRGGPSVGGGAIRQAYGSVPHSGTRLTSTNFSGGMDDGADDDGVGAGPGGGGDVRATFSPSYGGGGGYHRVGTFNNYYEYGGGAGGGRGAAGAPYRDSVATGEDEVPPAVAAAAGLPGGYRAVASSGSIGVNSNNNDADRSFELSIVETPEMMQLHRAAILTAVLSIACNVVGGGILTLPTALVNANLYPGLVMMLIFAFLSGTSMLMIGISVMKSKRFSYQELLSLVLSPKIAHAFSIVQFLYTFGVLVAFARIVAQTMIEFCKGVSSSVNYPLTETWFWLLAAAGLFWPLSSVRHLKELRVTSFLGLATIWYVAVVIIVHYLDGSYTDETRRIPYASPDITLLLALPMLSVAFSCHYNLPVVCREMGPSLTPNNWTKVVAVAMSSITLLYILLGVFAVLTFGVAVKGDILDNYRPNDYAFMVGRVGMFLHFACVFPIVAIAGRRALNSFFISLSSTFGRLVLEQRHGASGSGGSGGSQTDAGGGASEHHPVASIPSATPAHSMPVFAPQDPHSSNNHATSPARSGGPLPPLSNTSIAASSYNVPSGVSGAGRPAQIRRSVLVIEAFLIVLAVCLTAQYGLGVADVIRIIGALFGLSIVLVLPAFFYLRVDASMDRLRVLLSKDLLGPEGTAGLLPAGEDGHILASGGTVAKNTGGAGSGGGAEGGAGEDLVLAADGVPIYSGARASTTAVVEHSLQHNTQFTYGTGDQKFYPNQDEAEQLFGQFFGNERNAQLAMQAAWFERSSVRRVLRPLAYVMIVAGLVGSVASLAVTVYTISVAAPSTKAS